MAFRKLKDKLKNDVESIEAVATRIRMVKDESSFGYGTETRIGPEESEDKGKKKNTKKKRKRINKMKKKKKIKKKRKKKMMITYLQEPANLPDSETIETDDANWKNVLSSDQMG